MRQRHGQTGGGGARHGFVLPVVLLVLVLLAVLGASFALEMNADVSATRGASYRLQTRAAAEAGIQRVIQLLRYRRGDVNAWYDNSAELHRAIVWRSGDDPSTFGLPESAESNDGRPAYRFSIVADDPMDDELVVRHGATNEAAKLNINVASVEQLRILLAQVVPPDVSVEALADALVDWRDRDDSPLENGAESSYYATLEPSYAPKNRDFDTVEELLMVKGFTAQVLYGEDWDRNGLLSINEDDGEATFPLDDADGQLNLGLLPYITVRSRDFNVANDNKPRVNPRGNREQVTKQLTDYFSEEEIDFIITAMAVEGKCKLQSFLDLMDLPRESRRQESDEHASTRPTDTAPSSSQPSESPDECERQIPSPFGIQDLHRILDRLTLDGRPQEDGLIDVNTAPAEVLRCIPGMTEAVLAEILAKRATLSSEQKATPAWLLIEGLVDADTLEWLLNGITTRGNQFTVESLGYADHTGTFTRLQVIVEMRGPVAQIVYWRDLTSLGVGYPTRLKDEQGAQRRAIGTR